MASQQSDRNEIEELDREYTLGDVDAAARLRPDRDRRHRGTPYRDCQRGLNSDFSSQYVCTSLGYDADRVVDAITEQARTVPYVNPGWSTKPRARLSKKLAEITPGSLKRPSTLPVAPRPMKRRSKSRALTLASTRFFHDTAHTTGRPPLSLSASGDPRRVAQGPEIQPEVPGMVKGPDPYAYGSSLDPEQSLEYIDEMLELEGDTVAAVLVEPLVGSNGVLTLRMITSLAFRKSPTTTARC